jgi:hypothetical protein
MKPRKICRWQSYGSSPVYVILVPEKKDDCPETKIMKQNLNSFKLSYNDHEYNEITAITRQ